MCFLTYYARYSIVHSMVMGGTQPTPRDNLALEFRRGALVLAVLVELRHEEYGYSLKKLLAGKGLEIDEGTLYPLLRRLESQGLLKSAWRVEDGRPRRYYQTSSDGARLASELKAEWRKLAGVIATLID
jgi:PadR family transcriptional regulator, regulatory protein PadR